jgi:hypothetical protein
MYLTIIIILKSSLCRPCQKRCGLHFINYNLPLDNVAENVKAYANMKNVDNNRQIKNKRFLRMRYNSAYTGLNLPHAREKPATSPENFRHLAGEGCQCKRETTYCEEHTKNV